MNICVFGAARDEIDPEYLALGEALGELMARRGHRMIFGGGGHGLMGAAARGMERRDGEIVGVVPYFFNSPGLLFENCTEMIRMDTMAERKDIMRRRADAFVALPGGIGTMEEIFEVITLRSLGRLSKPAAFLDVLGYWLPAVELLMASVEKGFAGKTLLSSFEYFTDPAACLDWLEREAQA